MAPNAMDIQLQVRNNATDLQRYMSDLRGWEDEIHKKDNVLRGMQETDSEDSESDSEEDIDLEELEQAKAEARAADAAAAAAGKNGTLAASKTDPTKTTQAKPKKPASTTHNHYGKWDKFDVDKTLTDMEERDAAEEKVRAEERKRRQKKKEAAAKKKRAAQEKAALEAKEEGNSKFQAAQYEEAVYHYTQSLTMNPASAVVYANRAMTLLKLHKYAEAEEDCSAALLVDHRHVKALHRRGTARKLLRKYAFAVSDFEAALSIEPRNAAIRKELTETKLLRAQKETKERLAVTRRQVVVQEVEHDADNDDDLFVQSVQDRASQPDTPDTPADTPDGSQDGLQVQEPSVAPTAPRPRVPLAAGGFRVHAAALAVPESGTEFERDWRSIRKQPEEVFKYLKAIPPAHFAILCKQDLVADIFASILDTVNDFFFPDLAQQMVDVSGTLAEAFDMLSTLSSVGRFSLAIMFFEKKQQQVVKAIFQQLATQEPGSVEYTPQSLKQLESKYT